MTKVAKFPRPYPARLFKKCEIKTLAAHGFDCPAPRADEYSLAGGSHKRQVVEMVAYGEVYSTCALVFKQFVDFLQFAFASAFLESAFPVKD